MVHLCIVDTDHVCGKTCGPAEVGRKEEDGGYNTLTSQHCTKLTPWMPTIHLDISISPILSLTQGRGNRATHFPPTLPHETWTQHGRDTSPRWIE